jgi:hypothetical protein
VRKWYPDHKGFFAVSCCTAVSKKFLQKFYFWSKHNARPVSYRVVWSGIRRDVKPCVSTKEDINNILRRFPYEYKKKGVIIDFMLDNGGLGNVDCLHNWVFATLKQEERKPIRIGDFLSLCNLNNIGDCRR